MSDWPKPWGDIKPSPEDDILIDFATQYIDIGPLRCYDDTIYINADAGRETDENKDAWMPLEIYFAEQGSP